MASKKRKRSTRVFVSRRADLNIRVMLERRQITKNPSTGLVRHGQHVVWEFENHIGAHTVAVVGDFQRLPATTEGHPVPDWPFVDPPPWALAVVPKGRKAKVRLRVKDKHWKLSGLHRYSYSIGCPQVGSDPEIVIEWP